MQKIIIQILNTGFHHFGIPTHLAAGHEWRALANRPGFPHVPFFHHQPTAPHFPPHMLHLEQNRNILGLSNRMYSIDNVH